MKTQAKLDLAASEGEDLTTYHNFSRLSVIRRKPRIHWPRTLVCSILRKVLLTLKSCFSFLPDCLRFLAEAMQRSLAPLRKIVVRELQVLSWDRVHTDKPQSFLIHDHLECGHVSTSPLWNIFDLLYAYTENPEVKAKRHRCHPCASLLAVPKPVQSIGLAAKAGVA